MPDAIKNLASRLDLPVNVLIGSAGILLLLTIGSILRWIKLQRTPGLDPNKRETRLGSLLVWWGMAAIVAAILVFGRTAVCLTMATISFIALNEYFLMLNRKGLDHTGRGIVLLSIPAVYITVLLSDAIRYVFAVPFLTIVATTIRLVLASKTKGYLESSASLLWGMIVLMFGLAHVALLFTLPETSNPIGRREGWFLFLIVFTECADIFQALWGRTLGRRKITPVISPNKTWEGFLLGGFTAIAIGVVIAPFLTPLALPWRVGFGDAAFEVPYIGAVTFGIVLFGAAFFGDLNMSAVKRDVGVKDTGNWLPGQGGILDRIDSLTFTAPAFYYLIRFFYG